MTKFFIFFLVFFAIGAVAFANRPSLIGDFSKADMWATSEGRIEIRSKVNNESSAFDIWPTVGTLPTLNSTVELTLHLKLWPNTEQFNISATPDGQYRFGVEREGNGQFHNIRFCFENYEPGVAACVLDIRPDGVYVNDWVNVADRNWRKL